jgi:membrane-associated phospholipid phosphatase
MIRRISNRLSMRLAAAFFALPIGGLSIPAGANAQGLDVRTALEDTKLYFTAPLRWDAKDWEYVGGVVGAVVIAHQFDDNVRQHFIARSGGVLDGKDPNSTRDALPAAAVVAGTWAYAFLIHDSVGYEEGGSMVEAAGLSVVTAYALKFALGRERPNETASVNSWFKQGSSFPSIHTTAAFAIGTVLAESGNEENRWMRRALGYGMAGATAYLRLRDNQHWLSDTVAGAAVGLASANFVLQRRGHHIWRAAIDVAPIERGAIVTYSMALH